MRASPKRCEHSSATGPDTPSSTNPDAESGDEFGLSISLSDNTLQGFVGNQAGARLAFGPIEIDRTFLADALALLDEIIETSRPVRGDITADSSRTTQHERVRVATLSRSSRRSRTPTLPC